MNFAQRLQHDHAAALSFLSDAAVPSAARQSALTRLTELGLPGLRDDDFRYANLRPLSRASFAPAPEPAELASQLAALLPARLDGYTRCVLINGRLATAYSDSAAALTAAGVNATLNDSFEASLPDIGPAERFDLLNQAFATDCLRISSAGTVRLEVLCISLAGATDAASYPRLQVQLQPGADMTLIERHLGGNASGITVSTCNVQLGRDAQLQHYRLQDLSLDATWLDTLRATLDENAQYRLSLLALGGGAARSSVRVRLAGQGARLMLNGASLADGKRVLDTVIRVEHEGRDTRSDQLLRAVANEQSGISMTSRVEVSAVAGGADSRQSLKGLITAKGAEINLRPQLEILTDEVTASHGATTGALDENMLFYLLSRGLEAETARKLLEWAFIADVMSRIELPALRRQVEMATVTRMGNAAALESLL